MVKRTREIRRERCSSFFPSSMAFRSRESKMPSKAAFASGVRGEAVTDSTASFKRETEKVPASIRRMREENRYRGSSTYPRLSRDQLRKADGSLENSSS